MHRDLKLKSNNKFDRDDSDYASDDINTLGNSDFHSFSPRKQVRASTATKSGVHFSATKQTAVLRRERKEVEEEEVEGEGEEITNSRRQQQPGQFGHHIPFQESNGLRRIAMFATTVLAYFLLFFPM